MVKLNMKGSTIPHQVLGRYGSGQVLLKPAPEGTGIIAGGPVRAVMEVAGIQNVLTKSLGTSNPHNVIKATFDALMHLKDAAKVAEGRGKDRGGSDGIVVPSRENHDNDDIDTECCSGQEKIGETENQVGGELHRLPA